MERNIAVTFWSSWKEQMTILECIRYNTKLRSPFVPDHPAITTRLIYTQPKIFFVLVKTFEMRRHWNKIDLSH